MEAAPEPQPVRPPLGRRFGQAHAPGTAGAAAPGPARQTPPPEAPRPAPQTLAAPPPSKPSAAQPPEDPQTARPVPTAPGLSQAGRQTTHDGSGAAGFDPPADVQDLRVHTAGFYRGSVRLDWRWPDGADHVLVLLGKSGYPATPKAAHEQLRCERFAAEVGSGMELALSGSELWVRILAARRRADGSEALAPGLNAGCQVRIPVGRICRLTYRLQRDRGGTALLCRLEPAIELPRLQLVARKDRRPGSPEDGTRLAFLASGTPTADGGLRIAVPDPGQQHIALFPADPTDAPWLTLIPCGL